MSKTEPGTTDRAKAPEQDLRALFKQPPAQWVAYLEQFGITGCKITGSVVKLRCPFHDDNNPSATLDTQKQYFKCHSLDCGKYHSNPIDFLSKVGNQGYQNALKTYKEHFGLDKSYNLESLTADGLLQRRAQLLATACHNYLLNCWAADVRPEQADKNVKWLKQRGISDVQGIGCLGMLPRAPELDKLLKEIGASPEDIAGAKSILREHLNLAYSDCTVFVYGTSPERITAFKLRPPGAENKGLLRTLKVSDGYPVGVFGLMITAYEPFFGSASVKEFFGVEGEFCALSLYQEQLKAGGQINTICVALSGGSTSGVTCMHDLGFTTCRLVGDDDPGGDSYPRKVLPKTRDVQFEVFVWPTELKHPQGDKIDPDDAIKIHGFPATYTALVDPQNYLPAVSWCFERAKVQLAGVHPDQVQQAETIAKEFAALLTHDGERKLFVQKLAEYRPSITTETVMRSAVAEMDSVFGFIARIVDWLKSTYQVTLWDNSRSELTLWHCRNSHAVIVPTTDINIASSRLNRDFPDGSIYLWAEREIGLPSYLPPAHGSDATDSVLKKIEQSIEQNLQRALKQLTIGANQDRAVVKGQGIHLRDAETTGVGYMVNGNKAYKFEYNEARTAIVKASQLPGPVDGPVVFDLSPKPFVCDEIKGVWTELCTKTSDLLEEPAYSREETFEKVHALIDKVFGFQHQEVDSLYCATLVIYNYLYDVIPNKRTLTHITAEFESGKSSLLGVTSNHPQLREWSLCDHSHALDIFTPAGFYQRFSNIRLVACLDEMNDKNDGSRESDLKKQFYLRCRTLGLSGSATVSMGTQDGTGKAYHLQNAVITASGTVIHDSMDESRFNTIFMKKSKFRANARMILPTLHTIEEYQKLRKSIFLHCLHMAPAVIREYRNLYSTFASDTRVDADGKTRLHRTHRATENLMPFAAILNVLGRDGVKFLDDYGESRKKQAVEQTASTAGNMLIDTLLATPFPSREKDAVNSTFTIKSFLIEPDKRPKINEMRLGVYFDMKTQWLVVAWPEARQVFKSLGQKRGINSILFDLESAGSLVIPRADAEEAGVYKRMLAEGLHHQPEVVSVINVKEMIIDRVANAQKEYAEAARDVANQNAVKLAAGAEDDMPGM